MHLADAFIQSDLLIQAIHFLSVCNLIQDRVTISVTVEINVFNVSSKIPFLSNILI